MSATLPTTNVASEDLLRQLLHEQADLTAVERFESLHEALNSEALAQQPIQARYYRALMPVAPPTLNEQYAFQVDLDACSGCKACVVACHTLNGLEDHESWRRVGTITIGDACATSLPQIKHVTTACHHCADPGCLNGCPVLAYDKDPLTGIVRHLDDQCIGCKYCTMMCPYEVPQYSQRLGIVRKCDMCHQRLSVGEAPACVQACPNAAISIRVVSRTLYCESDSRLMADTPLSSITIPTTNYVSRSNLNDAVAQDVGIDHPAESHWPLAMMLVATQASVGLLVAERVAAMLGLANGNPVSEAQTFSVAVLALLVAAIGLAIAPLHLGKPLRAWRVFLGLRSSWLSREAVVLGKYLGMLVVSAVLLALKVWPQHNAAFHFIPTWAAKAALGTTLLLGVLGLYCSAMIYICTRRELWNFRWTMLRFFGSATWVGSLGAAAALGSTVLAVLAGAFGIAKLIWEWQTHLGKETSADSNHQRRSRSLVRVQLRAWKNARLALGIGSTLCLALGIGFSPGSVPALALMGCASLLALAGETFERLLYFSSVVFNRMPGALQ